MNQRHDYPRFFKNASSIGRLASQQLAKNNIKWSFQDHQLQPHHAAVLTRAKSAGSKDKLQRPSKHAKNGQ